MVSTRTQEKSVQGRLELGLKAQRGGLILSTHFIFIFFIFIFILFLLKWTNMQTNVNFSFTYRACTTMHVIEQRSQKDCDLYCDGCKAACLLACASEQDKLRIVQHATRAAGSSPAKQNA